MANVVDDRSTASTRGCIVPVSHCRFAMLPRHGCAPENTKSPANYGRDDDRRPQKCGPKQSERGGRCAVAFMSSFGHGRCPGIESICCRPKAVKGRSKKYVVLLLLLFVGDEANKPVSEHDVPEHADFRLKKGTRKQKWSSPIVPRWPHILFDHLHHRHRYHSHRER
jgi:hypothetical protein